MDEYLRILRQLQKFPKMLQSDFARKHARIIAEAASRGHITSIQDGKPTNMWRLSLQGHMVVDGAALGVPRGE